MRTTLERFFAGKFLRIPSYQRDYAWSTENVDELWVDVDEALRIEVPHYVGTFILAKKPNEDVLDVVDGQQRLTTLTMLVRALVARLPEGRERIVAEDKFLAGGERDRLTLLGNNQVFFQSIVHGAQPQPATQGQRRLLAAYAHIQQRVNHLAATVPAAVSRWIVGIGQLQVLEFVEENEGNAIRIFETVNDRGRPLSVLEKIKSHLIFVSNKYLAGKLDVTLSERFGQVFQAYDAIKQLGGKSGLDVELVGQKKFTEDSILRYHFISYPSRYHDWGFTSLGVLADFLKVEIKRVVASDQATAMKELEAFVDDYTADLLGFFQALLRLLKYAETRPRYFKLFTTLGLSSTLYPLLVRLEMRGLLGASVTTGKNQTLLDIIEATDVRVYKTRGTTPEKDVSQAAKDAASQTPEEIAARLRGFIGWYMNDDYFRAQLRGAVYGKNEGVRFILLEHEAAVRVSKGDPELSVAELKDLRNTGMTIEHSLAQEATFTVDGRGFANGEHYASEIHRLGNLTLLESNLNSAAKHKTPEQKASATELYKRSAYLSTRGLGVEIQGKTKPFGQVDIEARTTVLVDFCVNRWAV